MTFALSNCLFFFFLKTPEWCVSYSNEKKEKKKILSLDREKFKYRFWLLSFASICFFILFFLRRHRLCSKVSIPSSSSTTFSFFFISDFSSLAPRVYTHTQLIYPKRAARQFCHLASRTKLIFLSLSLVEPSQSAIARSDNLN